MEPGSKFAVGGAELVTHVRPVAMSENVNEAEMVSGTWLLDPKAGVLRSAVAVGLDDVTGYLIAAGRPAGMWPVSLGIRVDFLVDPPVDGSTMSVKGHLIARDPFGGTTRGSVTGADGRVHALVTQRSHLVPMPVAPVAAEIDAECAEGDAALRERLRFDDFSAGFTRMHSTIFATNIMGNVHGGILILGAELAAMNALDAGGDMRTTSIDMVFVRPAPATGVTTFDTSVVHRGRSVSVVHVVASSAAGKQCAHATVVVGRAQ